MNSASFISSDQIRSQFTASMSAMYREEVPQYARLLSLVENVNNKTLEANNEVFTQQQIELLKVEHHGAIRLGSAQELSTLRRLFNLMGMQAVDYYDLSVAGIPVHSTAFRAISPEELLSSPFRVFTSLLRLDLIEDEGLRKRAESILSERNIFSAKLLELINVAENQGGLNAGQAELFVSEALEVFRWHQQASVDKKSYDELNEAHRLIADVVCFRGPHINHLTPQTLDIDEIQRQFVQKGFKAKAVVEGPPPRACPILLRQTSFIALDEPVVFSDGEPGAHTARFGEVEQRGIALTPNGRLLYDRLLNMARTKSSGVPNNTDYNENLKAVFSAFPDSHQQLREQGLAYYRYSANSKSPAISENEDVSIDKLIENGSLRYAPITYEDFLPVSAAGIFSSNLESDMPGNASQKIRQSPNQASFEEALGVPVLDSFALYEKIQQDSLVSALGLLGVKQLI